MENGENDIFALLATSDNPRPRVTDAAARPRYLTSPTMEAIAACCSLLPGPLPVFVTPKAEITTTAAVLFPLPSSRASSTLRDFSFPSRNPKSPRLPCPPSCTSSTPLESKPSRDLGLLLEVEGFVSFIFFLSILILFAVILFGFSNGKILEDSLIASRFFLFIVPSFYYCFLVFFPFMEFICIG